MRFLTSVVVSILLFLSPYVCGQDTIFELLTGDHAFPDADFITLFDSTSVEVMESGLSYVQMHRLHKVQTAGGALQFRVVKMDYDPLSAFVDIRRITVYRQDGTKEEIPVENVLDYPAPARAIYWGAREKMLEIGRLEPGDAVEVRLFRKGFTYALLRQDDDERYIPPMRGHFYDIVPFWSTEPVIEKTYRVTLPASKILQYEFYNGDVQVSSKLVGGRKQLTFTKKHIEPFKKEPDMVDLSDVAPKLLLSTSPDWQAKSRWFYNVNEDYGSFETTAEISAKVREILRGAETEEEKIYRLTHWVADEIRYSGLSMGPGEGYTLHKGEMTFRDRCGVCKDKAGMLVTMLRAAGFESYAAMTMAGSRIDRIPADQFNHSVTVVKLSDGKYHLLDPTWVPFVRELWSSAEQQQEYLMGLPEGADLKTTPLSPPENHYYRLRGTSTLAADGALRGTFTLELEGQSDAVMRRMFTRSFNTGWQSFVESQMLSTHPGIRLLDVSYSDPYDYSDPFLLKISYEIPEYAKAAGGFLSFTPFTTLPLFRQRYINDHLFKNTALESRQYQFYTRCTKLTDIQEEIMLPDYVSVQSIPDTTETDGSGAYFYASYHVDGKKLNVIQKTAFKKRIYEPSDWASYRAAVLAQKELASRKIIMNLK